VKHGDQVFNKEKDSVRKLMDLLHSSISEATLQEMTIRWSTLTGSSPRWF
jgi:hypothetical protein